MSTTFCPRRIEEEKGPRSDGVTVRVVLAQQEGKRRLEEHGLLPPDASGEAVGAEGPFSAGGCQYGEGVVVRRSDWGVGEDVDAVGKRGE